MYVGEITGFTPNLIITISCIAVSKKRVGYLHQSTLFILRVRSAMIAVAVGSKVLKLTNAILKYPGVVWTEA